MLKIAFYKDDNGDVSEVAMHETDAASAIARFPWQWSADGKTWAKKPADPTKAKPADKPAEAKPVELQNAAPNPAPPAA